MITCKPKIRELTKDITLTAQNYLVEQTNKVKILGVYILSDLSQTANTNRIKSKVNYRLHTLKDIFKYAC